MLQLFALLLAIGPAAPPHTLSRAEGWSAGEGGVVRVELTGARGSRFVFDTGLGLRAVTHTMRRSASALRVIQTVQNAEISRVVTTDEHPFWSPDHERWVPAGRLRPGARLQGLAGSASVEASELEGREAPVYNLEVAPPHNYHVGPQRLLVHNKYEPSLNRYIHQITENDEIIEIMVEDGLFKGVKDGPQLAENLRRLATAQGRDTPWTVTAHRTPHNDGWLVAIERGGAISEGVGGDRILFTVSREGEIRTLFRNGLDGKGWPGEDTALLPAWRNVQDWGWD